MHDLPRIVRFGVICGNDLLKFVLTKVAKCNKRIFEVLICVLLRTRKAVDTHDYVI